MMKRSAFIFLGTVFFSCGNANTVETNISGASYQVQSSQTAPEYLDFRSVSINGELPFITSPDALYKLFGQPDSIIETDREDNCGYYFPTSQEVYLKGIRVEVSKDSAVVWTITFKGQPDVFVKTPEIVLNQRTTLSSLAVLYPQAVAGREILDLSELGKAVSIRLEMAVEPMEDAWLLFFQDDKLVRIDYYSPC